MPLQVPLATVDSLDTFLATIADAISSLQSSHEMSRGKAREVQCTSSNLRLLLGESPASLRDLRPYPSLPHLDLHHQPRRPSCWHYLLEWPSMEAHTMGAIKPKIWQNN